MKKFGFTLIELSIVLVIIGLIVGGVVVGQDLIQNAKLRSIVTDKERYVTAVNTFRLKYNCIPGDCVQASSFGLGNSGDGDKYISEPLYGQESWLFWTHLANAELIEGSYTGVNMPPGGTGHDATIGINVPGSSYNNVGFSIYSFHKRFDTWQQGWGVEGNIKQLFFVVGKDHSDGNQTTSGAAFSVFDTKAVDDKIDDGSASNGKFRTRKTNPQTGVDCTDAVNYTYSYVLTSGKICSFVFLVSF